MLAGTYIFGLPCRLQYTSRHPFTLVSLYFLVTGAFFADAKTPDRLAATSKTSLPPVRQLAVNLGVNHKTLAVACREL